MKLRNSSSVSATEREKFIMHLKIVSSHQDPPLGPTYLGPLARIVSSVRTGSSRLSLP